MFSTSRLLEKLAATKQGGAGPGTTSSDAGIAKASSGAVKAMRSAASATGSAVNQAAADVKKKALRARHGMRVAEIKRRSGGNAALEARWHQQWLDKRSPGRGKSSGVSDISGMLDLPGMQRSSTSSRQAKLDLRSRADRLRR